MASFILLTVVPSLVLAGAAESCPANGQLSCHNSTAQADTCCFNSPGGSLLQTQFWDTNPATGPSDSWTIHGLWPDNCDGTYQANCDSNRAYTNITQILQSFGDQALLDYMNTYWTSNTGSAESFWEHEWGKHGTCISTLDPPCYSDYQPTQEVPDFFNRTVQLFKGLNTYQLLASASITPSSSKTYSLSAIQSALASGHDGHVPYVGCSSGAIDEVWYYFNVRGSVQSGSFVASDNIGSSSNCPASVSYLPKSSSSSSATSTRTSATASPTGTGGSGAAFSGKGYLNVVDQGSQNGCLISNGKWYTTGTCATYTATPSGNGFTLKGSKGYCAVVSSSIDCTQSSGSVFSSQGNSLVYSGSSQFYAQSVPSGSTQATVYISQQHEPITIQWQGQ